MDHIIKGECEHYAKALSNTKILALIYFLARASFQRYAYTKVGGRPKSEDVICLYAQILELGHNI